MEPLLIDLPPELRSFVESESVLATWSTSSGFIRHLVEQAHERWVQAISNMAQEGVDSGPMTEWTKADADEIRRRVRANREEPNGASK
jgi:hypothetical protein